MPAAGGLHKAILNGKEIGCTAVQVFTSSPQQWAAKEITDEKAEAFRKAREETGIEAVVSHDSYLVNLAATEAALRKRSISALAGELLRCAKLGIPYAVTHMGAHKGDGEEVGLKRLAEGAAAVLAETPDSVSIAMETTAGQGTTMGYKFEHLGFVIEANKGHPRLVACLDTCHVFAAGYDIRTEETYNEMIEEFDRIVGLDRLRVIHVNDSMRPFASRKDRHAHIGQGEIGEDAFRRVVNDPRIRHASLILETPDPDEMHEVNLKRLKSYLSA